MATMWTAEQQKVIDLRNRNILVSAAAGSGKTAVLVERIIQRITDEREPVDVDRMLIVTYTEAAASEMKERIAAAIEKQLEQRPGDARLGAAGCTDSYGSHYNNSQLLPFCYQGPFSCDRNRSGVPHCGRRRAEAA